jgi:hypothetical protein
MRLAVFELAKASVLLTAIASGCAGNTEHSSDAGNGGNASAAASGQPAGTSGSSANAAGAGTFDRGGGAGAVGAPPPAPSSRCKRACAVEGPRPVPTAGPACPQAEPADGAACDTPLLTCAYGDSASAACRRSYDCQESAASAKWVLNTALQESYPCSTLPADYCPATPPVELTPCTVAAYNMPCVYGSLVCYCGGFSVPMDAGSSGKWGCVGPPADLACPALLPNVGEGCASEGTECDYADGCLDPASANVFCHGGAWEQGTPYTCIGK